MVNFPYKKRTRVDVDNATLPVKIFCWTVLFIGSAGAVALLLAMITGMAQLAASGGIIQ